MNRDTIAVEKWSEDMSETQGYKCPCCGGSIAFDSRLQKLKCPYCDTEFEFDTLKQFEQEHFDEDKEPSWQEEQVRHTSEMLGENELSSYHCESCGGEILAEPTMAAASCPFCGSTVIAAEKLSGALRPNLVIPFKLDKKQAQDQLRRHVKGKILLPKQFKSENRIQEIRGIYVPFWLYDCDARADIRCRATRVRSWSSGDYHYTETSHYLVSRSGEIGFEKVPADGSAKMDDMLMQSIEPFDYSAGVDFQTAYLAGYFADKYDQSAADCVSTVNARIQNSTVRAFMDTIHGYATCVPEHTGITLKQGKITYALLPVWILNTVYKGKTYTFAMNGQTGKFVGNLPMDKQKAAGIAVGVMAAATLFSWLLLMLI